MSRVAVIGAAGPVGRRVCALAAADPAVKAVRAIDREPLEAQLDVVSTHPLRLTIDDLDRALDGCDVVCHLARTDPVTDADPLHDLRALTRVLNAAGRAGVGHVVVRSSATVYGAHPDNPVPLTESEPVRPNAEAGWVRVRARIEDAATAFGERHGIPVAVIRPCITVSPDGPDQLGRVVAASRLVSPAGDDPATQFVHADDVAAAVDVVRRAGAAGVFNVAPDGAIEADRVRALVGGAPRVPLPAALGRRLAAFGWRYQLAPTPPGFEAFARHPWVVANDRIRALGWEPAFTNDEAFVAGHDAAPWAELSPQRRQELALGVAAGAVGALVAGAGALVVRAARAR